MTISGLTTAILKNRLPVTSGSIRIIAIELLDPQNGGLPVGTVSLSGLEATGGSINFQRGANVACGSSPWPRSGHPGREAATPTARGVGGALKVPSGSGRSPTAKRFDAFVA